MAAIEVDTATALAYRLSSYAFSPTVAAVMEYVPDHEGTDLSDLKVSVVPGTVEVTQVARGSDLHEFQIHVVMAKRLANDAEIATLAGLRSSVADKIRSGVLPVTGPAMPTGVQYISLAVNTTYDRNSLTNMRTFLSEIAVTYRANLAKDAT